MKLNWLVVCLSVCLPCWADDVIVYDPSDVTVPNRVTSYQKAVDIYKTGLVNNTNTLIWTLPLSNSPRPWDGSVPGISQTYWKVSGSSVMAMSGAEQTALNTAVASAADASLRISTKAQFDGNSSPALGLRCMAKILVDEINTARQRTNAVKNCVRDAATLAAAKTCETGLADLSDRTLAQAKTAIGTCVDSKVADEP